MALPPLSRGSIHVTVAEALPAVAMTPVSNPGAVGPVGSTVFESLEKGPKPFALAATMVK